MSKASKSVYGAAFVTALFVSATGGKNQPTTEPHRRPALKTSYQPNLPSKDEQDLLDVLCLGGMPKREPNAPLGPTRLIVRKGYALEHSSEYLFPLWVCERLTETNLLGGDTKGRLKPEPFGPDPALENKWPYSALADYKGSGFDRGHMSPDADHTTKALKAESYYLSNMVPQAGPTFNQQLWKDFEAKVRGWALERKQCWVITGAFLYDEDEADVGTADGLVNYHTIGPHAVVVPTHLYKIVVAPKKSDAKTNEFMAFVFENRRYEKTDSKNLADYVRPIDWIELQTGLDFMPKLTTPEHTTIEAAKPVVWADPPKVVADK